MRSPVTLALAFAITLGTWTAQGQTPPGPDPSASESDLSTEDPSTGTGTGIQDESDQDPTDSGAEIKPCQIGPSWLIGSQILLLIGVFVWLPLLSHHKGSQGNSASSPLKALNLPAGSVRSMLALAIVGTFLNVLAFGGCILDEQHFNSVLAAFGTLAGSVLGFYFGSRKEESPAPPPAPPVPPPPAS